MPNALRVLIVEDSPDDAELVVLALREGGYAVASAVVATESAYRAALAEGGWNAIICDHNLPMFDSIKALRLLQESGQDVPFIIVSGAIGEEVAVAAMKAGANDYVMKGNLARLTPAVEREIRDSAARRKQRMAEEALRLSEARLSGLIGSAMDAIISVDAEQRIVLFNPSAERIFGYASPEVMEQPIDMLLPERYRAQHRRHIDEFGETGDSARAMGDLMTLTARRRNGEEFPIEASISQLDVSGERYFTVILRDVTERVRAQAQIAADLREKELLLREVHHRVKNNLHVIASLLSLQASASKDPQAARALMDSESRVLAMGLVHDKLLISDDAAEVDFGEYLQAFLPQLEQLYRREGEAVPITIDAPGVRFDVDIATPMALTVNELVTNALKYAFPDGGPGEIAVTARGRRGAGHRILMVRDTGVGISREVIDGGTSFGLELVSTLAEQLGCTVEWDIGNGTTVSLVERRNS